MSVEKMAELLNHATSQLAFESNRRGTRHIEFIK